MNFQVVVITGAASGIGAGIAKAFSKLNAGLCITDINEEGLHKIGSECQELNKNKVIEIVADIRIDDDSENIVKCALNEFGKIDVLINCAGIYQPTNLYDPSIIEKFDKVVTTNLRSVIILTTKTLPALIESKGCIINMSSIGSNRIIYNNLVYTIAKAGLSSFTKFAAFELANLGVRVNSISPGVVKTNILKNAGISEYEENKMWDNLLDKTPMKKYIQVEEVAELAVFLASDKATNITGSDFLVDGGIMLGTI